MKKLYTFMLLATSFASSVAALALSCSSKLVEAALFLIAAGIFAVAAAIVGRTVATQIYVNQYVTETK